MEPKIVRKLILYPSLKNFSCYNCFKHLVYINGSYVFPALPFYLYIVTITRQYVSDLGLIRPAPTLYNEKLCVCAFFFTFFLFSLPQKYLYFLLSRSWVKPLHLEMKLLLPFRFFRNSKLKFTQCHKIL